MELCNIYCGFWEGMKEISVGVCLNEYTWLEICEKRKVDCSKRQKEKKMVLNKSKRKNEKKKKKKNISIIWALLCKVSGCDVIGKEKLCYTNL